MSLRALWLCLQVLGDVGRETLNESFSGIPLGGPHTPSDALPPLANPDAPSTRAKECSHEETGEPHALLKVN